MNSTAVVSRWQLRQLSTTSTREVPMTLTAVDWRIFALRPSSTADDNREYGRR